MKDIVWGDILSVEVDEIDEDHRKLLNIFNILNHSVTEGESPDYLAAVLKQEILQADKPVTDENIEFLERWLTEHILTADMRLGSYLSQVM